MFHPAYDVPRNAPLPTALQKHHIAPSVPEISMIFSNAPAKPPQQHAPRFCAPHTPLHPCDAAQKQVRFQSAPQEKQFAIFGKNVLPDKAKVFAQSSAPQKFADVYMANVPNRQLDLSLVENFGGVSNFAQQKRDSFSNLCGNNGGNKERFNCSGRNQTLNVTDVHSYKSGGDSFCVEKNPERALEKVCNDVKISDNNRSDEPTVKDLLKIIQQQNEQLLILQKQVSQLIDFQANQRPQITDNYCQRQTTSVFGAEKREFKPQDLNKGPLSKFAIDVTTSFEVSVRRQERNKFKQQDARIQEISCDAVVPLQGAKSLGGDSLVFGGAQLPVREDCPSPVNSVHVDMNDYSSESDDDDSSTSSCSSSSNIDWTLYNNIMDQVNNILRKAQQSSATADDCKYKDDTMKKVMEATVKHLKSVGINLSPQNTAENFQKPAETAKTYSPTEISFAVKQLLMKYLPPEHLARVVTGNKSSGSSSAGEEMVDLVKKRPEFSFATLQYMKKYNLIKTDEKKQKISTEPRERPRNNLCPKILDITALKQQPKLL